MARLLKIYLCAETRQGKFVRSGFSKIKSRNRGNITKTANEFFHLSPYKQKNNRTGESCRRLGYF